MTTANKSRSWDFGTPSQQVRRDDLVPIRRASHGSGYLTRRLFGNSLSGGQRDAERARLRSLDHLHPEHNLCQTFVYTTKESRENTSSIPRIRIRNLASGSCIVKICPLIPAGNHAKKPSFLWQPHGGSPNNVHTVGKAKHVRLTFNPSGTKTVRFFEPLWATLEIRITWGKRMSNWISRIKVAQ